MVLSEARLKAGLAGCAALLWAYVVLVAVATRHWPQISDDVLMHYVVFLTMKGFAPYRDIVDVNLPGSYAMDWAAGLLFRSHWRVFDWVLTAVAAGVFAREGRRVGSLPVGLLTAALFALWHVRDGVAQAGQRDFIVAVLLLLAYTAVLEAQAAQSPVWAFLFGLGCGAATTIKPQAVLFFFLLLTVLSPGSKRRGALGVMSMAGLLTPFGVLGFWLAREHALQACLHAVGGLMPYHAGMARHSFSFLLLHALPWQFLPFLLLAFAFTLSRGGIARPQYAALLGVLGGLLSFVTQGKAYPYHRYPLLAFTLLFFTPTLGAIFQRPANIPLRWAACAVLGYAVLWFGPEATARTLRQDWHTTPTLDLLRADLTRLGGPALEGRVQCMDTMAGCITALDRMRLTQATGFLYDCYLLAPRSNPVKAELRQHFAEQVQSRPPQVFVVTDQWCFNRDPAYRKLGEWPWFASWLDAHYTLAEQREFPPGSKQLATWPFGYRLYIRRSR